MAYDLNGRALRPLVELLDVADFPLADFLPAESLQHAFDGVYFTEAESYFEADNFVLRVHLAIEQELALALPGTDAFALVLCSGGTGWTSIEAEFVLGPDFSVTLRQATVGLRVAKEILEDRDSGNPTEIEVSADITFSPAGITVRNGTGAALRPAYLCGTKILVEALDVRPAFGAVEPPDFLIDQPDFQGIALEKLSVTLPPDLIQPDGEQNQWRFDASREPPVLVRGGHVASHSLHGDRVPRLMRHQATTRGPVLSPQCNRPRTS